MHRARLTYHLMNGKADGLIPLLDVDIVILMRLFPMFFVTVKLTWLKFVIAMMELLIV